MSAETLRRAGALMRDDAVATQEDGDWERGIAKLGRRTIKGLYFASWHPAVALAVAHWLDDCAQFYVDFPGYSHDGEDYALAVARAYLGEDA